MEKTEFKGFIEALVTSGIMPHSRCQCVCVILDKIHKLNSELDEPEVGGYQKGILEVVYDLTSYRLRLDVRVYSYDWHYLDKINSISVSGFGVPIDTIDPPLSRLVRDIHNIG